MAMKPRAMKKKTPMRGGGMTAKKKPAPFPGSPAGRKRGKGRLVGPPTLEVGGKRKRISADKVKGRINLGGQNVGKKGVVGTVGGKDVVGGRKKKSPKPKTGNLGKGVSVAGKRRKNKPNDPKLLRG